MASLDGEWNVVRVSGFLPPLIGMRKRIRGPRGETIVGPVRMGFEVRDSSLHYRRPFQDFVDYLELLDEDRYRGRATFRGREFGLFELRRIKSA